ncbi:MAG TPA: hypothetical protein VFZ68_03740 [Acidimicrobiales bacterium]
MIGSTMQLGLTNARQDRTAPRMIAVVAAVLLLGSGCSQSADDDPLATGTDSEATAGFLASAAERSAATASRFEVEFSMVMRDPASGVDIDFGGQAGYGEQQGNRWSMVMDLASMMEEMVTQMGEPMPPELAGLDMTVEMVTEPEATYMRAPGLAELSDMVTAEGGPPNMYGPLAGIGDAWGRIDIATIGDRYGMADLQSALGGAQIGDPSVFLDVVAGADQVRELGEDEVRGVAVRGLAADVSMGDVMAQQGIDPEEYLSALGGGLPPGNAAALDEFLTGTLPMEVWVDGDGYVRRLSFDLDLAELVSSLDLPSAPPGDLEMSFGTSIDFFDYGDESISVEPPEEWVDVTDEFTQFLETPILEPGMGPGIGPPSI